MKVGYFYYNNDDWAGGSYYLQSLIRMSSYAGDNSLEVYLFYETNDKDKVQQTISGWNDLSLKIIPYDKPSTRIAKILLLLKFRFIFGSIKFYLFNKDYKYKLIKKKNIYFWLGDLQNKVLPAFFDIKTLKKREEYQNFILQEGVNVVATSAAMKAEVDAYFRGIKIKSKIHVSPFVSFVDLMKIPKEFQNEYGKYFYLPNQFWAHKNHITVLKAFHLFKKTDNQDVKLIVTGKPYDYRNPEYTNVVMSACEDLNLNGSVAFLGFIDRELQINIYNHAIAVVQPSLYEGWNTSIEDAKALNKLVIASDIPVHREQLLNNGLYFKSDDYNLLSSLMTDVVNLKVVSEEKLQVDYKYEELRILKSKQFYNIFKN